MKAIGWMILFGAAAIAGGNFLERQRQWHLHEQRVARHEVILSMPRDEVRRSRGEADGRSVEADGRETWVYSDGLVVTFAKNRDYVIEAVQLEPGKIVQRNGRVFEISPVTGQIVSHANDVSYLQSVGLGGDGGAPRLPATPRSSVLTKQWGWNGTTSSLDKPAHR